MKLTEEDKQQQLILLDGIAKHLNDLNSIFVCAIAVNGGSLNIVKTAGLTNGELLDFLEKATRNLSDSIQNDPSLFNRTD